MTAPMTHEHRMLIAVPLRVMRRERGLIQGSLELSEIRQNPGGLIIFGKRTVDVEDSR
jgi:hypothetical protein